MRRLCWIVLTVFLVAGIPANAPAIVINPIFHGFDAAEEDVIQAAIGYWMTMVGGGHQTQINLSVDNSMDALGVAFVGGAGLPTNVDVAIRANALNWTSGAPSDGSLDSMHVVMHEIGHAIGWSVGYTNFGSNVQTVSGNRFYDLNHNGAFDSGTDFNLINDPAMGTHAAVESRDLMEPFVPSGTRYYPTYEHAGVLTDAFGYGVMLQGFGGDAGYGELVMGRNDDGSSNRLNLPFEINFSGNTYDTFFVNNNGNLTFESPLWQYTPEPFPVADQPMIAPYWADVDTSNPDGGEVYVAAPYEDALIVTWAGVGYYDRHADKTNDFQVVLRRWADQPEGDFTIEFRYDQLEWTTGDASGGSTGLGGVPAYGGYDAGNFVDYFQLPGSGTAAVLNWTTETNTGSNVNIPGLWVFHVRDGNPPGTTPDNPLMPIVRDNGWQFDFNIGDISSPAFIDPLVAIGYDYFVDYGPNFASVLLPSVGDNIYDLWLWDEMFGSWADSGVHLYGGTQYDFDAGGMNSFRILGIEPWAGLDPYDVTAFVTGLWFTDTGIVSMRQVPVTFDTGVIPAPCTILLGTIGTGLVGWMRRRRVL